MFKVKCVSTSSQPTLKIQNCKFINVLSTQTPVRSHGVSVIYVASGITIAQYIHNYCVCVLAA